MADCETYRAVADAQRAKTLAATTSPFTIEARFLGGLTGAQQEAFAAAADRWIKAIAGDLPDVLVDGGSSRTDSPSPRASSRTAQAEHSEHGARCPGTTDPSKRSTTPLAPADPPLVVAPTVATPVGPSSRESRGACCGDLRAPRRTPLFRHFREQFDRRSGGASRASERDVFQER
jgi:hypothetical protein